MRPTLARFWSPGLTRRATRWENTIPHISRPKYKTQSLTYLDQVWSQKIGTQLSAAHTVVESGSNVIVGGGLYKVCFFVAYISLLHIYLRCIYISVAYISSLHTYLRCIYIFVAYLSSLHVSLRCIYIFVAYIILGGLEKARLCKYTKF